MYMNTKPTVISRSGTMYLNGSFLRSQPSIIVPQSAAIRTAPIGPFIPVASMAVTESNMADLMLLRSPLVLCFSKSLRRTAKKKAAATPKPAALSFVMMNL